MKYLFASFMCLFFGVFAPDSYHILKEKDSLFEKLISPSTYARTYICPGKRGFKEMQELIECRKGERLFRKRLRHSTKRFFI